MLSPPSICAKRNAVNLFIGLELGSLNLLLTTIMIIIIIIIMSWCRHRYHWSSLTTSPYRSSPLAGFQGHIPYPHIAAGCMSELVVLLLPYHMWGVHRSTSLMSSSLLLQQWPACLVRLAWIVFVMGGRWPYSWCLVGYCHQDLFNIGCNILV